MAVPAYVDGQTQDSGAAVSITFDMSTITHSTDDLMIAFVKQSENIGAQVWNDDGGGGEGWTQLAYNRSTSGRDMEVAIYYKFATSGTENDPTFDWDVGGTNSLMSGALLVYSGVDTVVPFQGPTFSFQVSTPNPTPPAVDVNFVNTRVVTFQGVTHDDITTVGVVTGFTMRHQVWNGTADDHRNIFVADIERDTIESYQPPDWQHTVSAQTPESQVYTMALNEAQAIHITGGTGIVAFFYTDTGLTVTGDGFEASQNGGKVEYWSDQSGTIKTEVTNYSGWSDTSITFDPVQGSLDDNTVVYLVVTNDSADESAAIAVGVGLATYPSVIVDILKADHYWRLNNTYADTGDTGPAIDMNVAIVGSWTFNAQEIVDGNTHSLNYSDDQSRRECNQSPNMNITIVSDERTIGGWMQFNQIQHALASVYEEGGGIQNMCFFIGYGNVLLFSVADDPGNAINAQAWSGFKLAINRPYNVIGRYSLTDNPKEVRLYIDGVEQPDTLGNPLGTGTWNAHSGDISFNKAGGQLEVGGTDITFQGLDNAQISDFASWSDNSAGTNAGGLDPVTEIRDQCFRRGALPDDIIATDTEANMQTAIAATADARPDWPLSYRIMPVTGDGDFELILDDKVFDSLISAHLEYRGSDTLTIVRPLSSNFDESLAWSVTGGTIEVIDLVDLVITVLDIDDLTPIENARVRMEGADTGGTYWHANYWNDNYWQAAYWSEGGTGAVLLEGLTNASGVLTGTYRYGGDQNVVGRVRQSSTSTFYKTAGIVGTITNIGLALTIFMIKDE